jgi:hypothetical protein
MRITTRHYKANTVQYGIMTWATPGYRAFDFFCGTHLFVLGFRRG